VAAARLHGAARVPGRWRPRASTVAAACLDGGGRVPRRWRPPALTVDVGLQCTKTYENSVHHQIEKIYIYNIINNRILVPENIILVGLKLIIIFIIIIILKI